MLAVIETGGKQYMVTEGTQLTLEKISASSEKSVTFDKVLLLKKPDAAVEMGHPYIRGAQVTATILEQKKEKKKVVFKFKRKTGYKQTYGHRQHKTIVKINHISSPN